GRVVLRERHRDLETLVGPAYGDRDVGARHRFWYEGDGVVFRGALPQIGQRQVEPGRQHTGQVEVVDRPQLDEQLAETFAGRGLLEERFFELGRGDQLALDQELSEHRHPGITRDGD